MKRIFERHVTMKEMIKGENSKFSKLTLGTVQLGLDYSIQDLASKPDVEKSLEILQTAAKVGINTLDTARTYGDAENIIGNFKKKFPDELYYIVTKFKITTKNLNNFDLARAEVYESVKTSLSALRAERISVCLFHQDNDQPMPVVMKILPDIFKGLMEDGLIEVGGISVCHPYEVRYILDHDTIKVVQAPMNVFDQRLKHSGLLQEMYEQQKIIFIRSVFLKGLFFISERKLVGNLTEAGKYIKILRGLANYSGVSVAQLAFSYVRDMKEVTSIVVGADNEEQVQQNARFLHQKNLDPAICETIENEFRSLPETIITPHLWKH